MALLYLKRIAQPLGSLIGAHYASASVYVLFQLRLLDKSEKDPGFHYKYPAVVFFQVENSADAFVLIYGHHACLFSNFAVYLVQAVFLPQEDLISNTLFDFFWQNVSTGLE